MQRKNRLYVLCAISICLGLLTGCGDGKKEMSSSQYVEKTASAKDTDWTKVESGAVVLENEKIRFSLDSETTHFVVEEKGSQNKYYSSVNQPLEDAVMELNEKAQSEIYLSYYDEQSQKLEMNSMQHSVAFQNYRVLTDGERVRVYYTLQLKANPPFVPPVLDENLYQKVTEKLDSTTKFKVKLMYKVYEPDSTTVEAKEAQSKYPYGKEHRIYVLNSKLSDTDRTALSKYIETAGYTQEEYLKDIADMNFQLEEEVSMYFTVPVEYAVTENGFEVKVLSDLIESGSKDYHIQSISVLPYFNCGVVSDSEGYMLLPDGSGSIMNINQCDNAGYTQKLYGLDLACENQETSVLMKNAAMPLFGYSSGGGSFLSFVEGAAPMAKVNAYRAGNTEYLAHAYTEFELYSTDSFTMRKSNVPLAVFTENIVSEQPCVKYHLLKEHAEIMDMASVYRKKLIEEGKLATNEEAGGMNLYLEFTGYIEQEATFLGVSYNKKIVLSTIKEIKKSVEALYADGIEHIYVRLTGYSKNGGKYHGLSNGFSLESKVGTKEELVELAELLEAHGGGLFLEEDFVSVYKDTKFDNFSSTSDVLRRLDKTLADVSDSDMVTGKTDKKVHIRYLVSPKLYESLAKEFAKEADVAYISFGEAGKTLVSDFNSKNEYDRIATAKAMEKTMRILQKNGQFMTDVGNEYSLPYTTHFLNMALTDSNFEAEDFSIPFYQLVLFGYKNYAGEALNMAANQEKIGFASLMSGANLYYSCVTDRKALESLKGDQDLYPTTFEVAAREIRDFYEKHQELYGVREGKTVTGFEILSNGLYQITYDNEVQVVFNETKLPIELEGQIIEAQNYMIRK